MTFHNSAWIASDQPVKPGLKNTNTDDLLDIQESLEWERLPFEVQAQSKDRREAGAARKALEIYDTRLENIKDELERRGRR